jgi:hypothetical protein
MVVRSFRIEPLHWSFSAACYSPTVDVLATLLVAANLDIVAACELIRWRARPGYAAYGAKAPQHAANLSRQAGRPPRSRGIFSSSPHPDPAFPAASPSSFRHGANILSNWPL